MSGGRQSRFFSNSWFFSKIVKAVLFKKCEAAFVKGSETGFSLKLQGREETICHLREERGKSPGYKIAYRRSEVAKKELI